MPRLLSLSERRRRTARANGAKSRGPVTAAGKARSSRNAVKHGFCSRHILPEELPPGFVEQARLLIDELNPSTPLESELAFEMAIASHRMDQLREMEAAAFNAELATLTGLSRGSALATAFQNLVASGTLPTLNRYEVAEGNRWNRAFAQFIDGRRSISKKQRVPNEPRMPLTIAASATSVCFAPKATLFTCPQGGV